MAGNDSERIAYIAGITGSIGSDLAQRLTKSGWTVAGIARDADKIAKLKESLGITCAQANCTDAEAVNAAFEQLEQSVGTPTAYIHAVGSIILKPGHQTKDDEWHETINLNLNSAFYGLRAAVKAMKQGGSIVLISSTAAQVGLPSHEAIAAAKGGVEALARSAAATYAGKNLRVNSVALGLIDSNMSQPIVGSEMGRKVSEAMHPLGRIGQPADATSLIAYLISDEATWVSGQSWAVDGGLSKLRQKPKV
ncbi:MAG: SDR family NAD(P)-dependent oxidoreductase [Puniceicoccales bacterium]